MNSHAVSNKAAMKLDSRPLISKSRSSFGGNVYRAFFACLGNDLSSELTLHDKLYANNIKSHSFGIYIFIRLCSWPRFLNMRTPILIREVYTQNYRNGNNKTD